MAVSKARKKKPMSSASRRKRSGAARKEARARGTTPKNIDKAARRTTGSAAAAKRVGIGRARKVSGANVSVGGWARYTRTDIQRWGHTRRRDHNPNKFRETLQKRDEVRASEGKGKIYKYSSEVNSALDSARLEKFTSGKTKAYVPDESKAARGIGRTRKAKPKPKPGRVTLERRAKIKKTEAEYDRRQAELWRKASDKTRAGWAAGR